MDLLLGLMLIFAVGLLWRRYVTREGRQPPPAPPVRQAPAHDEGAGWYVFGYHHGRHDARESQDAWDHEWHDPDDCFDDGFDD